jgi:hypothetical protein
MNRFDPLRRMLRDQDTPMTAADHRRQRTLVQASLLLGIKDERPPVRHPRGVGR